MKFAITASYLINFRSLVISNLYSKTKGYQFNSNLYTFIRIKFIRITRTKFVKSEENNKNHTRVR